MVGVLPQFEKGVVAKNVFDGDGNPRFTVKLPVAELVRVYDRIADAPRIEVFADVFGERGVAFINEVCIELRPLWLVGCVAEVLCERLQVALCAAFLAVVLARLGVEVQMRLVAATIGIAVVEQAFGDKLAAALAVFDAFFGEVLSDSNGL